MYEIQIVIRMYRIHRELTCICTEMALLSYLIDLKFNTSKIIIYVNIIKFNEPEFYCQNLIARCR